MFEAFSAFITVDDEEREIHCFPVDLFATATITADEDGTYYIEYTDVDGQTADTLEEELSYIASQYTPVYYYSTDTGNQDSGCVGDDALFY